MLALIGFFNSMLGRESGSKISASPPCSSLLQTARCSSAMPIPMANSLRPTTSHGSPLFRLNSTGEEDYCTSDMKEMQPPTYQSIFLKSSFNNTSRYCVNRNISACPSISCPTYPRPMSSSPIEKPIPWLAFSPAVAATQSSSVSSTDSIRSSQSLISLPELTQEVPHVPVRMATSCESVRNPGVIEENHCSCSPPKHCRYTHRDSISSADSSCKNTSNMDPENHLKQKSKDRHIHFTMQMSPKVESENHKNCERKETSPAMASASVNVKVQITSPPSSVKSCRKKSRPSSKKRRRRRQKQNSDCTKPKATMSSSSSSDHSPKKQYSSQNSFSSSCSDSLQSFTVTFLDLSAASHDSSVDFSRSPLLSADNVTDLCNEDKKKPACAQKFSFLIQPDLDSDDEECGTEKVDDTSVKDQQAPPSMCSKLLAVIQSSDYDSDSSGSLSEEEDDDDDWDEEDSSDQDNLWESFSNQGLVNLSFTCSITPMSSADKHVDGEKAAGKEEEEECTMSEEKMEAVERWAKTYGAISNKPIDFKPQKVCFPSEKKELATVHEMVTWDFAYRQARIGPWERMYRDSLRFQNRINQVEEQIGHVFSPAHRSRIFAERFEERIH